MDGCGVAGGAPGVAHAITGRVVTSLRAYFAGVSVVATFNPVVIRVRRADLSRPCPHARQGGGDRQAGRPGSRTGTELAGIGGGASC